MQKELLNAFDDDADLQDKAALALSVHYNNAGYRLVVINEAKQTIAFAYTYRILKLTPAECFSDVSSLLDKYGLAFRSFKKVTINQYNSKLVLLPGQTIESDMAEKSFNFCFGNLESGNELNLSPLGNFPCTVVSQRDVSWNEIIRSYFDSSVVVNHQTAHVIDVIQAEYGIYDFSKSVFLNFYADNFEVIHIKDKKVNFYNNFSFINKEDVIYYLAAVSKELGLNFETMDLTLMGEIVAEGDLVTYLKKYVRKVSLFTANTSRYLDCMPVESRHYYV